MIKIPVFVYGSLKSGFHNHHFLKNETFIGIYITGRGLMFDLGAFPAIILPKRIYQLSRYIKGELYNVSPETLSNLDRLEGNGHFYTRKIECISKIENNLRYNEFNRAWVYSLADTYFQERETALLNNIYKITLGENDKSYFNWDKQF